MSIFPMLSIRKFELVKKTKLQIEVGPLSSLGVRIIADQGHRLDLRYRTRPGHLGPNPRLPKHCRATVEVDGVNKVKYVADEKVICMKLPQEPDLHGIMCSVLQILFRQNRNVLGENYLIRYGKKRNNIHEVAEENLKAIRSFASKMLSALPDVFLKPSKDIGGCL